MLKLRIVLTCAALLLVGLTSMPVASATAVPLPVSVTVGDRDDDGYNEVHVQAATPPCLCACPVVGAGVDLSAAGQEVYAVGIDGLCSYFAAADVDPADVDPLAPIIIDPFLICGGSPALLLCDTTIMVPVLPTDAAAAQIGLFQCWTTMTDAQHDGSPEAWQTCSTPPCGCNCPYAGAGFVIEAADHQVGVAAVTSGCQTAYATTNGEGDGGPPATVWPIVGGGGLGDINTLVDLS